LPEAGSMTGITTAFTMTGIASAALHLNRAASV